MVGDGDLVVVFGVSILLAIRRGSFANVKPCQRSFISRMSPRKGVGCSAPTLLPLGGPLDFYEMGDALQYWFTGLGPAVHGRFAVASVGRLAKTIDELWQISASAMIPRVTKILKYGSESQRESVWT